MFLNKVKDQKVELLRAVFRNMYLKEKHDYLESECKMLAEHVLQSQVAAAARNDNYLTAKEELDRIRQLHEWKLEELKRAQEKVGTLSMIIEDKKLSWKEDKSLNEVLDIKNDMIKCLQEELIHVRLNEAEKWALIRDLKQIKLEYETETEMLTKAKPKTIAHLQEELMTAKILETHYASEFDQIKQQLATLKINYESVKDGQSNHGRGSIKLSKLGALSDDSKIKEKEIIDNIKKLEEEKQFLQNKIPELHNKINIMNKHADFKEEQRRKLQEELDSRRIKQKSIESITQERRRQYYNLETSGTEKVFGIRSSCGEKALNIEKLYSKLDDISNKEEDGLFNLTRTEFSTIQSLEQQIAELEEKITNLTSETIKLKSTFSLNLNGGNFI